MSFVLEMVLWFDLSSVPECVSALEKFGKKLIIHVLPGQISLLLARSDLESWNIMVNYGKKFIYTDAVEVKTIISSNDNYII